MSSSFILELDTTPPEITINAPSYTTKFIPNTIYVTSNEILSDSYENIYIVDSNGATHDIDLSFDGNKIYSGSVIFKDYPNGVATIYAQLKDDVGNVSQLVSKTINVIVSSDHLMLRLSMLKTTRGVTLGEINNSIILGEVTQGIYPYMTLSMNIIGREATLDEKTQAMMLDENN